MQILKFVSMGIIIIVLSSCATIYKEINPISLEYKGEKYKENITLRYKYNLLRKKYARKERKNGVELIGIQLINNSDKNLVFEKDIILTKYDGSKLYIMEKEKVYNSLEQNISPYFLYLLFPPIGLNAGTENRFQNNYSIQYSKWGYLIGISLTLINMGIADNSNKEFEKELFLNYLENQTIKKGDTLTGFIGVKSTSYDEISFELK